MGPTDLDARLAEITAVAGGDAERAIAGLEAALHVFTRDDRPHEWAVVQRHLGDLYRRRAAGEGATNRAQAVACYLGAVEAMDRDAAPADWAALMSGLGQAYLDEPGGDRWQNLELAIACLTQAFTRRLVLGDAPGAEEVRVPLRDAHAAADELQRARDAGGPAAAVFLAGPLRRAFGSRTEQVLAHLMEFLGAQTWAAGRRVVEEHPELVEEPIARELARRALEARIEGRTDEARRLDAHRRVLETARREGVAVAFAGLEATAGGDAGGSGDRRLFLLLWNFLDAHTWSASRRLLEENPELLDARVLDMLDAWIASARAGRSSMGTGVELFERHRRVLAGAAQHGVPAAFAELRPDHKGLDPPEVTPYADQARNYEQHFRTTGNTLALDIAIAAWEAQLADMDRADAPAEVRAVALNDLGVDYWLRYQASGQPADLDAAVERLERAAGLDPPEGPPRSGAAGNLAVALQFRYARDGDVADLERSLRAFESVAEAAAGTPDEPGALNNLGNALSNVYKRTGDLAALERAADLLGRAAAAAAPGSDEEQECNASLGAVLMAVYSHARTPGQLDAAIGAFERALACTPAQAPGWAAQRANLGMALLERHDVAGDARDLDQAVAAFDEALERTPVAAPEWPAFGSNLAHGLRTRYVERGDMADLDRAIEVVERGLAKAGTGAAASQHDERGRLLVMRHYATGGRSDPAPAVEALRTACAAGLGESTGQVLTTAQLWWEWAADRGEWTEAVEAGGYALDAHLRLFRTQVVREHRESWLRATAGLPARIAYSLARAGRPADAVVGLERSRSLLLSEVLDRSRADLARLGDADREDLVERYRRAASRIDDLERGAEADRAGWTPDRRQRIEALRDARSALEAAVAEIRAVPGHERFLDPPTIETVRAGAGGRPIVYLAATSRGGVGVVVAGRRRARISTVWLPDLTAPAVTARLASFRAAHDGRLTDPAAWRGTLDAVTRWLWRAVMGPILDALGGERAAVIVPAGTLGLLPLHAAWCDDHSRPTGRRYAVDVAALSYAPNARSLEASATLARRGGELRVLTVAEPRPVDAPPLPLAGPEAEMVAALHGEAIVLRHEKADRDAVIEGLAASSVHHLACHGSARLDVPLESSLLLAGHTRLTLGDLLELRLADGARLTVLSACETQLPGAELIDEVVSLPTGLLQAGVAGVVASQWAVHGLATAVLMARFHRGWRVEGLAPADSLRAAQQWVRDSTTGDVAAAFDPASAREAGLPETAARAIWRALVRRPRAERGFWHPADWAAFVHVGV